MMSLWRRVQSLGLRQLQVTKGSYSNHAITLPHDFPAASYQAFRSTGSSVSANYPNEWAEISAGWNALSFRFRACAEHEYAFTYSVKKFGIAPPPEQRFIQEREIFGFFVTGLSVIECVCYVAYFLGGAARPASFPNTSAKDRKWITPASAHSIFSNAFPNDKITLALDNILQSSTYKEWRTIRNILAHRSAPPRGFSVSISVGATGSGLAGSADWASNVQLDDTLCSSRRAWLSGEVKNLIDGCSDFASQYL